VKRFLDGLILATLGLLVPSFALVGFLAACSSGASVNAAGPGTSQTPTPPPTTFAQISHPLPTLPPKATPPAGSVVQGGGSGAEDVYYHYSINSPPDGYDALNYTMSPQTYETSKTNEFYYGALQNYYQNSCPGCGYYFGLQPLGQYGKTALFSVFGAGTSSSSPACAAGADGGPGTSCHIPYGWTLGHFYDFTVTEVGSTSSTVTWKGNVTDDNTGTTTLIGDVTVPYAWGLLSNSGSIAFDEYFGSDPCPKQPFSENLYFTPTGYRGGTSYAGAINSNGLVKNAGCNVVFYSDASTYAYIDAGYNV